MPRVAPEKAAGRPDHTRRGAATCRRRRAETEPAPFRAAFAGQTRRSGFGPTARRAPGPAVRRLRSAETPSARDRPSTAQSQRPPDRPAQPISAATLLLPQKGRPQTTLPKRRSAARKESGVAVFARVEPAAAKGHDRAASRGGLSSPAGTVGGKQYRTSIRFDEYGA